MASTKSGKPRINLARLISAVDAIWMGGRASPRVFKAEKRYASPGAEEFAHATRDLSPAVWSAVENVRSTSSESRAAAWCTDSRPRCARLCVVWTGSSADCPDAARRNWAALRARSNRRDLAPARDSLFFLPANDRRLSERRRLLHRR